MKTYLIIIREAFPYIATSGLMIYPVSILNNLTILIGSIQKCTCTEIRIYMYYKKINPI